MGKIDTLKFPKETTKFNDIPFLFSCFDNEFPKCYPEVDKRIDETYIKDRDNILVLLEENSCNFQNTDSSLLNNLKQFLKNNELSFGKKLEYVLTESEYLHSLLGRDKEVQDFTKRIREFRNSLIHGRKFKYDKPIDFKELIIFEKINYYLVVKRSGLTEDIIKDFISSIFFAFENNMMKKD